MNQKKNKKIILILIIILCIVILGLGIAYIYTSTDLLKNDKQNFIRYTTQIMSSKNGLIDEKLTNYYGKKNTTPYKNEGKIEFDMTSKDNQNQLEGINDFNISFSGATNKSSSKSMQEIKLNYSEDVNLPMTYQNVGDIYGVQIKNIGIGNEFVAFEASKSKNITNLIDISAIAETKEKLNSSIFEQKKNEKNKILSSLSQLDDNKFIKITNEEGSGYRLTLTEEEAKKFLENIIETTENDESTLEEYKNNIEQFINGNVEITAIGDKGKFTKITISIEEFGVTLEKSSKNGQEQIKMLVNLEQNSNEKTEILFTATYDGLSGLDTIKENYEIELKLNKDVYKYKISNVVNFVETVDIEDLTNENSLILTNSQKYPSDRVTAFMEAVNNRLEEVNKDKLESAGIAEIKNPFNHIIPKKILEMVTANNGILDNEEDGKLSEIEISAFNATFTNYESTKSAAQTVRGLMSVIQNSNKSSELKIEELNLNGEEYKITEDNIEELKNKIEIGKNYRVEFEMDPVTGAIYRAVINEVADNAEQSAQP